MLLFSIEKQHFLIITLRYELSAISKTGAEVVKSEDDDFEWFSFRMDLFTKLS